MPVTPEELENDPKFRLLLSIPYGNIVSFVLAYLKKHTLITLSFFAFCILSLAAAVYIRIMLQGSTGLFLHTILGFILFPAAVIPLHEMLHVIPYYAAGARNIRAGMDLSQFMFYVTAHRHVTTARQFISVALFPFVFISLCSVILIVVLPGLWKWSLAAFLFAHATMCAGDFALVNFYFINRDKKIYTWDDADKKEAYFYEEIKESQPRLPDW